MGNSFRRSPGGKQEADDAENFNNRRAGLQGTEPEEELVDHLISAFRRALQFLNEVQNQLQCRKLSFEFSTHLSGMLRVNDIDQYVLLFNANNDRVMANAKIFLQTGGLGVVKELHSLLLAQSWDKICHIDLQLLERALLRLLLPVCAAIPKQEHHNIVNLLDNIVGSFLRVSISSQHMALPDNPRLSTTSRADQFQVLAEVIVTALQCICSVSEDEEHQIQVVSNQKLMKQFVGCLQTPTFKHGVHTSVLCCIENLLYNPSTHLHICKPEIVSTVMSVSDQISDPRLVEDMDPALCSKLEHDLVKYFGCMMIAQLVLTREAVFPEHLIAEATLFLKSFLSGVDCDQLHKWMVQVYGFMWQDLFPNMRLVYSPSCHVTSPCQIDMLCLEAALVALHIILRRDKERQLLIEQGLLGYLICLPWYMQEGNETHRRTKSLLDMVGSHVTLQPPSLSIIVRAKLAAMHCGLKKAVYSDWHIQRSL